MSKYGTTIFCIDTVISFSNGNNELNKIIYAA